MDKHKECHSSQSPCRQRRSVFSYVLRNFPLHPFLSEYVLDDEDCSVLDVGLWDLIVLSQFAVQFWLLALNRSLLSWLDNMGKLSHEKCNRTCLVYLKILSIYSICRSLCLKTVQSIKQIHMCTQVIHKSSMYFMSQKAYEVLVPTIWCMLQIFTSDKLWQKLE